jgi:SecD/SecF fusion protein
MISFIIAFILVLIYMVLFYRGAGVAADIALLCNVLFLFGTLVSFGAVLTLPGIAGLVLTMGMAVDANVIIYERVKEELASGKGLGKAIADGYSNAFSAIFDGQVTTLLTGIVLFVFGSGPVQGFATTLIIGIITSVITSIFITRLIFEARVARGKNITFDISACSDSDLPSSATSYRRLLPLSSAITSSFAMPMRIILSAAAYTFARDSARLGGATWSRTNLNSASSRWAARVSLGASANCPFTIWRNSW